MPGHVHYTAAGTTRPACGAAPAGASTTATIALVTCEACRRTTSTINVPTPHGRTNK
ncbi:hypothetical protein [Microbacterium sp. SLBN-146]|uniref:hypothetical protein n=1 Tax=Microbacterium sp. SLBN-146 TaxID=2768457 RepID=UPI0013592CA6|nr:hypothetical protein [Microbacterium sp. SLBN-146]